MSMIQVILATTNKGKLAELGEVLAPLGVEVAPMSAFPDLPETEETGDTFAANALLKARAVALATGRIAIADDSGLMVDALAGAPGVRSARYAEDWQAHPGESRDQLNMRKLLHAMRPYPIGERSCRFVTAMAAAAPNGAELVCEGQWPGVLLEAPLGSNGFGYDPVFWDPELNKSAAEISKAEKNAVSHRGQAVRKLIAQWPSFLDLAQSRH